jgi:hypothetical protein
MTVTAREAAEAISDGISWLAFLTRSPTADDMVSNRAAIQKALTEMAAAIDGQPGRVCPPCPSARMLPQANRFARAGRYGST